MTPFDLRGYLQAREVLESAEREQLRTQGRLINHYSCLCGCKCGRSTPAPASRCVPCQDGECKVIA